MRSNLLVPTVFLLIAPALCATTPITPAKRSYSTHDYYVLERDPNSRVPLSEFARVLGLEIVEQVGELEGHWLARTASISGPLSGREEPRDVVLERLESLKRGSSSHLASRSDARHISSSIRSLERQTPRQRYKKRAPLPVPDPLPAPPPVAPSALDRIEAKLGIKDPRFEDQWHILNMDFPGYDLNVSGIWEQGITGKGVFSAMVDDGLDFKSDDLAVNFNQEGSWDYNDNTNLPAPRLSDDRHGTRCAGEIAAAKNDVCGVGIAYESKIAGIRILSGPISDADEAASLNYGYQQTSIYSCSWGPPDDGKSMEEPSLLIQKAFVNGVQKGRGGKGSIFVFASGNGAASDDQCNFDGYTNSIYSVTVAAVDNKGKHPYYSEACSANMIVAYSSGGGKSISTTDVGKNSCTNGHGGTSAAAPLAAGVISLALQVRPELTWRDVQHLCVRSAQQINPDDPDWEKTSVGRPYSYKYGYGSLDAWFLVELAKTWSLVKPQAWIDIGPLVLDGGDVTQLDKLSGGVFIGSNGVQSTLHLTADQVKERNFEKLEHVTVKVWIQHARRGDVEVEIVSPKGIKSILAAPRRRDDQTSGYPGWTFMSIKHWEEDPIGAWTITVKDQNIAGQNGSFIGWSMSLWGSTIDASKAIPWTFPVQAVDDVEEAASTTITSTVAPTSTPLPEGTSKTLAKPTDHLPDDHHTAEGDSDVPAFSKVSGSASTIATITSSSTSTVTSSASASPITSVTPDEGYFSHMGDLLSSQNWLFGAIGLVALFGILAGLFFWRRRARQRAADYSAVTGTEDHPMGSMDQSASRLLGKGRRKGKGRATGEGGTKELYEAFDEPSDDDSSADEEDELVHGGRPSPAGLRYHDGFLEDDESSPSIPTYRDDPTDDNPPREGTSHTRRTDIPEGGASSPSGNSGESWEHASADVPPR